MTESAKNPSREAQALQAWMDGFPPVTVERLRKINSSTGSATHVVLALGYGIYDKNIAAVNRTIIRLLLIRMRAEKDGNELMIKRIQNILAGLHSAIDNVTGNSHRYSDASTEEACRSVSKNVARRRA